MAATDLVHFGISADCDCLIHERRKIFEKETFVAILRESSSGLPQDGTPVPKHVGVDNINCILLFIFYCILKERISW
jgi:hypothetical protein